MKPVLAVVPREVAEEARAPVPKDRGRQHPVRKRILKDSRLSSRGYILSFTVPAGGE